MPVDSPDDNTAPKTEIAARSEADIAARLLEHYRRSARDLPWRVQPGDAHDSSDAHPYRVWLSEIMLQQTTVAAVKPYFEAFTTRWPTVQDLAAADDADVLAAWAGLGYYARARNLIACARVVAHDHDGVFPTTEAELLKLPGVGAYTAAAIAAIAFGQRAVVVDANVERVVARLFAIETPLPAAKAEIRAATDALTPDVGAGDFAQAMMDLGATICTARAPACAICPLMPDCAGRAAGIAETLPVKPAKKAKPARTGSAFWIERDGQVWLVQRPGKGMLAGMRALPDDGWHAKADGGSDGVQHPPLTGPWETLNTSVSHVFSHFSLEMKLILYRGTDFSMLDDTQNGQWWPLDRLDDAGLPTLFAKAAKAILARQG